MQLSTFFTRTAFLPILVIYSLLTLISCTGHLTFSTRCLVMPDILDNEWLLNGLERIPAFSEDFLGSFIPRVPLACLKYRERILMTNPQGL